jgi:hypothetical protein
MAKFRPRLFEAQGWTINQVQIRDKLLSFTLLPQDSGTKPTTTTNSRLCLAVHRLPLRALRNNCHQIPPHYQPDDTAIMDSAVFVDSGSYHTPESKYTGSLAVSLSISTLKCSVCNITVKWLYTLLDAEPTLVFPLVVAYFMIGYAVSVMSLV